MKSAPRNYQAWIAILAIQLFLIALVLLRLYMVRKSVLAADQCLSCQSTTLIQHEAGLWVLIWLLFTLASLSSRWLRLISVIAVWLLIFIIIADIFTLQQFGLRLYLADVIKFGAQPRFFVEYLSGLFGWFWLPLFGAVVFVMPWLTIKLLGARLLGNRAQTGMVAMALVSGLVYSLPDRTAHPLPWTYQNLIEANWPKGVDREFSPTYLQSLLNNPPQSLTEQVCVAGQNRGGDVIIVAVESLSAYHTALLLPGTRNASPLLDQTAKKNSWWDQFYANGFTTDHGLIALLAGRVPLPAINRYRSSGVFNGFENESNSLPMRLSQDNYFSAFITSGDLSFLGKDQWLKNIGFDHIEGNQQKEYAGAKRYGFGSVSDDLLYQRASNWLNNERPESRPVAVFIETVTTHSPFINPETGESNETEAFQFADRALAGFIQDLTAINYFSHGLLIITSDQRSLTPISPEETNAFGSSAGARLPLIMLGSQLTLTGLQTNKAQMADLPFSLDYYLTDQACHLPGQGNLFTGQAPDCIYQVDGNQRSVIHAFCGADTAKIRMNGDDTELIEGYLPNAQQRIRELDYLRARLGVQTANMRMLL